MNSNKEIFTKSPLITLTECKAALIVAIEWKMVTYSVRVINGVEEVFGDYHMVITKPANDIEVPGTDVAFCCQINYIAPTSEHIIFDQYVGYIITDAESWWVPYRGWSPPNLTTGDLELIKSAISNLINN